jgi:hypothetical protein
MNKHYLPIASTNSTDLVEIFQQTYINLLSAISKPLWGSIAHDRLFKNQTLVHIGSSYNLTRERVRQIETYILQRLYLLLSTGVALKSHHAFFQVPSSAESIIFNSFVSRIQARKYISYSEVVEIIKTFSYSPMDEGWVNCLMMVCGYNSTSFEKNHSYIDISNYIKSNLIFYKFDKKSLISKISALRTILFKEPLKYFIPQELGTQIQEIPEDVACLLGLLNDIDKNPAGYRVKKDKLCIPDLLYRILSETGRVMTRTELTQKLTDVRSTPSIISIISQDPRFVAVHQHKAWALKEWGFNTESLREVMVRVLKEINRPISAEELHKEVIKYRSAPLQSIKSILHNRQYHKDFCLFIKGWGLTSWKPHYQRKFHSKKVCIRQNIFEEKLVECLKNNSPLSLQELYVKLNKKLPLKYGTFYNKIIIEDSKILLSIGKKNKRFYFLKPDYIKYLAASNKIEQTLHACIQLLQNRHSILLRTAIKELERKGFYYPTIYKVFSNKKLFVKKPVPGLHKRYVVSLRNA